MALQQSFVPPTSPAKEYYLALIPQESRKFSECLVCMRLVCVWLLRRGLCELCLLASCAHQPDFLSLQEATTISRCYQPGAQDHFSLRGSREMARDRYYWWDDGAMQLDHW